MSTASVRILLCMVVFPTFALHAQTITSVVNNASSDAGLSPGTLATINGTNLGSRTTFVSIGPRPAEGITASPVQLVVQIVYNAVPGPTTVRVGDGPPFPLTLLPYSPGLYGNVLHSSGVPVTAASPAVAGETITVYATGLGPTV